MIQDSEVADASVSADNLLDQAQLPPCPPIQFSYITSHENLESVFLAIRQSRIIALDCEGVALNRDGQLTMLQIATENHIYLFDVIALSHSLFDKGLRAILEHPTHPAKVVFDCRVDSDCLFHHFNVKLKNLFDISVADVYCRKMTLPRSPSRLNGYRKCVEEYLSGECLSPHFLEVKQRVSALMNEHGSEFWARRPLQQDVLEYAAYDVKYLLELYKVLQHQVVQVGYRPPGIALQCISEGSELFASLFRDKEEVTQRSPENSRIARELFKLWNTLQPRAGAGAAGGRRREGGGRGRRDFHRGGQRGSVGGGYIVGGYRGGAGNVDIRNQVNGIEGVSVVPISSSHHEQQQQHQQQQQHDYSHLRLSPTTHNKASGEQENDLRGRVRKHSDDHSGDRDGDDEGNEKEDLHKKKKL